MTQAEIVSLLEKRLDFWMAENVKARTNTAYLAEPINMVYVEASSTAARGHELLYLLHMIDPMNDRVKNVHFGPWPDLRWTSVATSPDRF